MKEPMLFHSYIFLFGFLPITLGVFILALRRSRRAGQVWLLAASVFFYGWWNVRFVPLLLGSIVFNFLIGAGLVRYGNRERLRRALFVFGIAVDLGVLCFFKYSKLFIEEPLILPLGISFFTFTQIAFLADVYCRKVEKLNWLSYSVFVTYFPHLIAGPILHHAEIITQLEQEYQAPNAEGFAVGSSIFLIGLFKKTMIADSLVEFVNPVFGPHVMIDDPGCLGTWAATLAFALQIYFDFSGYSDMAIGISKMFGIRLPLNFNSPYRATSIRDFWHRWHMSLSRFLRDYLYIPLGGNRRGLMRRDLNILLTMLIGGIWHGAGWMFLIWGALHGIFLVIERGWERFRGQRKLPSVLGRGLTLIAVVLAWVWFRADSVGSALTISGSLLGRHGMGRFEALPWIWIAGLCPVVLFTPNVYQIFASCAPALKGASLEKLRAPFREWSGSARWAVWIGVLGIAGVLGISRMNVFLYFQF